MEVDNMLKVPSINKIVRTVPLRVLRPKYSDIIEITLKKFKEEKDNMNTSRFWKAIRDKNSDFFKNELSLSEEDLMKLKDDTLFRLGLDNRTLFSYLSFLQERLMQEYNKIISKIYLEREKIGDFDKKLADGEIDKFIEEEIRPVYGSYLGYGIKSIIKSNLGGNFVRLVDIGGKKEKINK